jgi:hypothetical protein
LGQCRKTTNFDEAKICEKALFYAGFQHFAIHSNLLNFARLTTVNPLRFSFEKVIQICSIPTKTAKQYSALEKESIILYFPPTIGQVL